MNQESRRPGSWQAAVFDLDGTLIDTRPGVRAAISAAFSDVTGDGVTGEGADLSLPLVEMIRRLDPKGSPARHVLLADAFRRHYDSVDWRSANVYQGADGALQALADAGIRLFVVTNKRSTAAERLLGHFDLAHHFETIMGQADLGDPVAKSVLLSQCLTSAHLKAETTVLVGDSDQDAAAARSSGAVFVAVTSGAGPLGHATGGEERVEVVDLEEASAFVLGRSRGEHLES